MDGSSKVEDFVISARFVSQPRRSKGETDLAAEKRLDANPTQRLTETRLLQSNQKENTSVNPCTHTFIPVATGCRLLPLTRQPWIAYQPMYTKQNSGTQKAKEMELRSATYPMMGVNTAPPTTLIIRKEEACLV